MSESLDGSPAGPSRRSRSANPSPSRQNTCRTTISGPAGPSGSRSSRNRRGGVTPDYYPLGQANPNIWVHMFCRASYPTPVVFDEQLRMFALWPGLFIQPCTTAAASG